MASAKQSRKNGRPHSAQPGLFGARQRGLFDSSSTSSRATQQAASTRPQTQTPPVREVRGNRVRDAVMGAGTIIGEKRGFLKVKWDGSTRPTLIKEDQLVRTNPGNKRAVAAYRKNVAQGFVDHNGVFHPIRASEDYNEFLAGDFETGKADRAARKSRNLQKASEEKYFRSLVQEGRKRDQKDKKSGRLEQDIKLQGRTLSQFVRGYGGMKITAGSEGELKRLSNKGSGSSGIVKTSGIAPDYMREAANQDGYVDRDGKPFKYLGDFLQAVEEDLYGSRKFYSHAENPGVMKNTTKKKSATKKSAAKKSATKKKSSAKKKSSSKKSAAKKSTQKNGLGSKIKGAIKGAVKRSKAKRAYGKELKAEENLRVAKARRAVAEREAKNPNWGIVAQRALKGQPVRSKVFTVTWHSDYTGGLTSNNVYAKNRKEAIASLKKAGVRGVRKSPKPNAKFSHYVWHDQQVNPADLIGGLTGGLGWGVGAAVAGVLTHHALTRRSKAKAATQKNGVTINVREVKKIVKRPNKAAPKSARTTKLAELAAFFKKFRGFEVTKPTDVCKSKLVPNGTFEIGDLRELVLQNQTIKFPAGWFLAGDASGNLHITGHLKNGEAVPPFKPGQTDGKNVKWIDEVKTFPYGSVKTHIGGETYFIWVHKAGENGGQRPVFGVDMDGYPVLRGGDYELSTEGIIN
jgi:hypothetical protein